MPILTGIIPAGADAAARDAWRWWISELRGMLPAELRVRRTPSSYADVWASPGGIMVERVQDGTGERLAEERPLEAMDADGWAELESLIGGTRTRLLLGHPDIFSVTMTLPAAARRRLRTAVALQLGQYAPIEPALLVWNTQRVAVTKRDVTVRVVMARQSRIEQIETLFGEHGLPTPPIYASLEQGAVKLTNGFEGGRTVADGRDRRAWAFAAMLLASVPFTTLLGAKLLTGITESRIASLQQEIAPRLDIERRAAQAERLRAAFKPMFDRPAASDAIENLALGMPDNAYATEMEQGPDALRFTVEATDTDALNGTLAKTPLLANVATSDMAPAENGRMRVNYRSGG